MTAKQIRLCWEEKPLEKFINYVKQYEKNPSHFKYGLPSMLERKELERKNNTIKPLLYYVREAAFYDCK
jgi:hypothetical protein